jgi:hypothetical protein
MAPNLVNSQWTAEASTMPTEGHTMAPEPHTKMWICIVVYTRRTHEGHTMATRRRIESTMRLNYITQASRDLPMV